MPVISTTWLAAVGLALLLAPSVIHARNNRVLITEARQLATNKQVREQDEIYSALSAVTVAYSHCDKHYQFKPEQRTYLKAKLDRAAHSYLQAFQVAYETHTGSTSPQVMVNKYVEYINKKQKYAIEQTAEQIKTKGCRNHEIARLVKYPNQLRQLENAKPKPQKPIF